MEENKNWSMIYLHILKKNMGKRFLEISKEDLGNILLSMEQLKKYCTSIENQHEIDDLID